jgi:DNA repair protein RadC
MERSDELLVIAILLANGKVLKDILHLRQYILQKEAILHELLVRSIEVLRYA